MTLTTRQKIILLVIAVMLAEALAVFVIVPLTPIGRQRRNLKLAAHHAEILRAKFGRYPQFNQIDFEPLPVHGGCLSVAGHVSSEPEVRWITNVVGASHPPAGVDYVIETPDRTLLWYDRGELPPQWVRRPWVRPPPAPASKKTNSKSRSH